MKLTVKTDDYIASCRKYHFKLNKSNFEKLAVVQKVLSFKNRSKVVEFFIEKGIRYIDTIYEFSDNHRSKRPESNERVKELRIKIKLKHYRVTPFDSSINLHHRFSLGSFLKCDR